MNRPAELHRPTPTDARPPSSGRKPRSRPGQPRVPAEGSRQARQRAAVVLDVLAGVCTPAEAAQMASISLPRYYVLEARLLAALVNACEDQPRGHRPGPDQEIATLKREVDRLKQECARKQALVRAVQRTMGMSLPDPKPLSAKQGRRRRRRRPVVRALRAAAQLRTEQPETQAPGA